MGKLILTWISNSSIIKCGIKSFIQYQTSTVASLLGYWAFDYLSTLGFKSISVGKRGLWGDMLMSPCMACIYQKQLDIFNDKPTFHNNSLYSACTILVRNHIVYHRQKVAFSSLDDTTNHRQWHHYDFIMGQISGIHGSNSFDRVYGTRPGPDNNHQWKLGRNWSLDRNGKVVRVTTLVVTGDVEVCLQRL